MPMVKFGDFPAVARNLDKNKKSADCRAERCRVVADYEAENEGFRDPILYMPTGQIWDMTVASVSAQTTYFTRREAA